MKKIVSLILALITLLFCLTACRTDKYKDYHATNMEIYDYVNAVNNIEISEDKTKVYNSSNVDIYAVINGQRVIIPAKGYAAL